MSVLADYFAAGSDEVAATAVEYVDGQPGLLDLAPQDLAASKALYKEFPGQGRRPRVQTAHSGLLIVRSRRLGSVYPFARLEEFLTGRPYDDVVADPRHEALVAPALPEEIDGCMVLSITDTLRDALALLETSALPEMARRWAIAEFDESDAGGLADLLAALTDLARQAGDRGERLYCYCSF
jgi:hypothetical protein